MQLTPQTDSTQSALWNGAAGRAWIDAQGLLDQMFKPLEALLAEAVEMVRAGAACHALDIGCGTGSTTLAIARLPGTACVGIDISAPMIAVARARAAQSAVPAQFISADAQHYALPAASFDVVVSRFGVMFFDQPGVAFANLRRAVRDDGVLRLIAWRSAADNPFMTTAERAAAPLLPELAGRQPNGPGQFAFGDRARVTSMLEGSGWVDIQMAPLDVVCTFPERELVGYFTRLGPVGLALQAADERTRGTVIETVRRAFEPFVQGTEVRYTAACWMIKARAPSRA